jgi:hypothetical protein
MTYGTAKPTASHVLSVALAVRAVTAAISIHRTQQIGNDPVIVSYDRAALARRTPTFRSNRVLLADNCRTIHGAGCLRSRRPKQFRAVVLLTELPFGCLAESTWGRRPVCPRRFPNSRRCSEPRDRPMCQSPKMRRAPHVSCNRKSTANSHTDISLRGWAAGSASGPEWKMEGQSFYRKPRKNAVCTPELLEEYPDSTRKIAILFSMQTAN